ncbi:MAG TPA: zinc-dependent peptidase [Panacibacter sp.]|nr:zinc-dependent peptidase [Panacibacter sp.]
MYGLIIFIISISIISWLILRKPSAVTIKVDLPQDFKELLLKNVAFYRALNDADKIRFEEKIKDFLSYVNIQGVNTETEELDKLLVASSAVIPVFGFDNWHYYNLQSVLLYADAFTADNFSTNSGEKNTLGMVGTGAMQQMMILSKPSLRLGFKNETDKNNTGIHEFVHLLDKADGETDGIPEQLLTRQYTIPWLSRIKESIDEIRKGKSDINPYGSVSTTEFFAVAAEYFFERPDLFKVKHPELSGLMEMAFQQKPETKK